MTTFILPDLGEGLPDAEIHQWYVKEGDVVKLDQPIVAMETAKAVVDVPSPYAGRISKLHGKVGDIITTGAPLVSYEIAEEGRKKGPEGEGIKEKVSDDSGTVVGVIETSDAILEEPATGIDVSNQARQTIKAAPAVRALASKLKVDLNTLKGTGPGGSITLEDVSLHAQTAAGSAGTVSASTAATVTATATPGPGEPLRGVRRAMATQMAKSHAEIVPVTLSDDADLHRWPQKTDITLRIIEAIVAACKAEPQLNAYFYGQSSSRELCSQINLGIAVDTTDGLYVPVLNDVANRTSESLRAQINEFKNKATTRAFTPEDLQNATITLSNFGTIAGKYATPIIVPPMVAIIGVGKAKLTPVAVEDKVAVHPVMPVCLTFDHRVVTGGEAARFLRALIDSLEK